MKKFIIVMVLTLSVFMLAGCAGDNKIKTDVAQNEEINVEEIGKDISLKLELPETLEIKSKIDESKKVSTQYKDIKEELEKDTKDIEKKLMIQLLGIRNKLVAL